MTYSFVELSAQDAKPVLLYEFVQGDLTWRYAASPSDISHASETCTASSVSMSEIKQGMDMSKNGISLKFHQGSSFAQQFLGPTLDQVTSVKILRGHLGDGEFVVYWRGRVVSGKASNAEISLECESVFTSLRRPGLRARYQKMCRHGLYGARCGVVKATWAVGGSVSALDGVSLTVPAAAGLPDGWFSGGMVEGPGGVARFVLAHAGAVLSLSRPFEGVAVGAAVTLYPGCDRSTDTCATKFSNLLNHGGFPAIPAKNPMGGSSIL